ncbi:MAG: FkbM family methyltransferase [Gammaproteobacteria bacterium]|nr:FkbM family methyltransferase [Gammaproteobacteria bacterium]
MTNIRLKLAQLGRDTLPRLIALGLNPRAWVALITWPKFSVASFEITSELLRQGIVPETVIDIGANVGQFAVASLKTFPQARVHSFEPQPDSFAQLSKNVASFSRSTAHAVACGDFIGSTAFHVNTLSHSSSILPLATRHLEAFPEYREASTIEVKVQTLDSLMPAIQPSGMTLLKIDVQGFEAKVLAGASEALARVDYVLLEASLRPLYEGEMLFPEMLEFMKARGFRFLRPLAWMKDPHNGEVLQMDALFGREEA